MYKQVEAAKTAKLENGCEITPIATLVDNAGGVAHIWIDDHCYQLGLESSNGEIECKSYVVPVTHIFAEAFDVLKQLPSLSKNDKGFAYSQALAMAYCHKHGQCLATGRCDKCDDELIALGKDKIKELEAKAKTLEERACTCAAKDMPFGRCCKSD